MTSQHRPSRLRWCLVRRTSASRKARGTSVLQIVTSSAGCVDCRAYNQVWFARWPRTSRRTSNQSPHVFFRSTSAITRHCLRTTSCKPHLRADVTRFSASHGRRTEHHATSCCDNASGHSSNASGRSSNASGRSNTASGRFNTTSSSSTASCATRTR